MIFTLERHSIRAGAVLHLRHGFAVRLLATEPDGVSAYLEEPIAGALFPYAVVQIAPGERVPPMALYLGAVAPELLPKRWRGPLFSIPRAALFYLVEART